MSRSAPEDPRGERRNIEGADTADGDGATPLKRGNEGESARVSRDRRTRKFSGSWSKVQPRRSLPRNTNCVNLGYWTMDAALSPSIAHQICRAGREAHSWNRRKLARLVPSNMSDRERNRGGVPVIIQRIHTSRLRLTSVPQLALIPSVPWSKPPKSHLRGQRLLPAEGGQQEARIGGRCRSLLPGIPVEELFSPVGLICITVTSSFELVVVILQRGSSDTHNNHNNGISRVTRGPPPRIGSASGTASATPSNSNERCPPARRESRHGGLPSLGSTPGPLRSQTADRQGSATVSTYVRTTSHIHQSQVASDYMAEGSAEEEQSSTAAPASPPADLRTLNTQLSPPYHHQSHLQPRLQHLQHPNMLATAAPPRHSHSMLSHQVKTEPELDAPSDMPLNLKSEIFAGIMNGRQCPQEHKVLKDMLEEGNVERIKRIINSSPYAYIKRSTQRSSGVLLARRISQFLPRSENRATTVCRSISRKLVYDLRTERALSIHPASLNT
ncbi:hypothetical protein KM043_016441 [Ampulex compressa]|nr:hypothetical protein KM043_016441 [Ampulex compressa]